MNKLKKGGKCMKKKVFMMSFIVLATCLVFAVSSVTAQNLLTNPGAEAGNMAGWSVLSNGGNGWGIWGVDTFAYEGPRSGNNCFLTSYGWDTRSQLIDLLSMGHVPASLDTAPPVQVEEWFGQANPYDIGQFYLKVELRDINQNVIASYNSGTQQTTWNGSGPASWSSLSHTFTGYGPGLRYIYWEDGGKDSNVWGGYYGAKLDDALLAMCIPPPANMVSWWTGDGHPNDIQDGNNGTFAANTYAAGMVGQAFSFDGADDYVVIPNGIINYTARNFTVDAWVYADDVDSQRYIFYGGAVGGEYSLSVNENKNYEFGVKLADGNWYKATTPATAQVWSHVVGLRRGTSIEIWVDGALKTAIGVLDLNLFIEGTHNARIGAYNEYNSQQKDFWKGLIDEVEIFNRALSAEEIAAIYDAGSLGKCTPTRSISGRVTTRTGAPLAGVKVNLSGDATAVTTTDIKGRYSFTGLANGTYTITPRKIDYTFTPLRKTVTINNGNLTRQNFIGYIFTCLRKNGCYP